MKQKQVVLLCAVLLVFSLVFEPALRKASVPAFAAREGVRVLIDPGHGGIDSGAVGVTGVVEKDVNLQISQRLSALFEFCGVSTDLTRERDEMLAGSKVQDARARVAHAAALADATLISVHLNFYPQESCRGAQVFYSKRHAASEDLATTLQAALVTGLDPENHRAAKPVERNIYLMQNVSCPAVLVECGFLSNYEEEQNLTRASYQKRIAVSLAAGYLTFAKERSGTVEGENDLRLQ